MSKNSTCLIEDCQNSKIAKGLCNKHYLRKKYGREERGVKRRIPVEKRFWEKVIKTDSCWLWTGATRHLGYGTIRINGLLKAAHRVSYELIKGEIPEGLVLDHLCRTPSCVNPDHLEPVTQKINALRGISFSAINSRKTHCPKEHPLSGENLYIYPDGRRGCRSCIKKSSKHK